MQEKGQYINSLGYDPSKQYEKNSTNEAQPFFEKSITFGAKSAWNMFNMQFRDWELKAYEREQERLRELENNVTSNFDKKGIEFLKNKYTNELSEKDTQENFDFYKEQELKNLKEYNAFYEMLDDTPTRLLTSLSYGATKNVLNPIELGKNVALNYATMGMFKGVQATGWGVKLGMYAFDVLVDTIDNFCSNRWEDNLLRNIRKTNDEQFLEALGGAVVGNGVVPAVKYSGKIIKGLGSSIENVLDDISFKDIAKRMREVDILDLSSSNPVKTLKNVFYFDKVKSEKLPENSFGVNLKREIEKIENLRDTGFDNSAVNFREMFNEIEQVVKISHEEAKTGKKFDAKSIKYYDKNTREIVNNYIVKPIEVTEKIYKNEYKKRIQAVTDKYDDDILSMDSWYKNINERLADDLEDETVASSLIDSGFSTMQKFTAKEGVDIDSKKLQDFGDTVIKDFREAIGRGVTYTTNENGQLFISHPKYNRYFNISTKYEDFDVTITEAINDYVDGKLSYSEIGRILFYQKDKYNIFKEMKNLENSFEGEIVAKIQKVIKEKGINPNDEKIKEFINVENVGKTLKKIKERKINIALLSLSYDKSKMYDFFIHTKDFFERQQVLGDRIDSITIRNEETQEDALNRIVKELFLTTKKRKAVAKDVDGTYVNFADGISKDLIDVVKDNFEGKTTKEKMRNFIHFMDLFKKDNISMLNTMEKITTSTKASITSLGIPLYQIESVIKNDGGLLQLAFNIPVFRKNYKDMIDLFEKSTTTYEEVENSFKSYMENYFSHKNVFKNKSQTDVSDIIGSSLKFALRNYFLALSGLGETVSHPILTAVKSAKYYNGNFFIGGLNVIKNAPRTYLTIMLRELKPITDTSYALKKLYKGLGSIIGDEELAELEFARCMETLSPIRDGSPLVEGVKIWAETAQKVNLHIQGSMQNLRYVCARYQGIDIIKKILKKENFDNLDSSTKDLLKSLHISDNEKFLSWKTSVNEVGLKNALYINGKSDITKYIHSYLTDEFYSEDPIKMIRSPRSEQSFVNQIRTMFTTFTNDIINYYSDAAKFYKGKDGIYRSRLSKAYLKHLKENPKENLKEFINGSSGLMFLGMSALFGKYLDSIVFQGSKDEEIEAKIKAVKDSGKELKGKYILDIGEDIFSEALNVDSIMQSGNVLKSAWGNLKKGKVLPKRMANIYNAISGTPVYTENPYGMDWYVKSKYNELVIEDKNKRLGFDELNDLLTLSMADTLAENGEISQEKNLEIKRNLGIDDRKEAQEIENSKNYKTILNISIAQGGVHKSEQEFQNKLMNNINKVLEEDKINSDKKEVLKKLDVSEKVYDNLEKNFKLTPEEEKELNLFMKTVVEPNHLKRMMIKANKTREIIEKRYR